MCDVALVAVLCVCQLHADVLRLKERCAVTRRELAVRLSSPHVAQIRQSCDTKVGLWLKASCFMDTAQSVREEGLDLLNI